jgi:hypothetical protein
VHQPESAAAGWAKVMSRGAHHVLHQAHYRPWVSVLAILAGWLLARAMYHARRGPGRGQQALRPVQDLCRYGFDDLYRRGREALLKLNRRWRASTRASSTGW